MRLTNVHGISLPLAVWLLHDQYDYIDDPTYFSATSLLKSTRQIILSKRVVQADMEMDISSMIASRFGTAIHDSIEKAWFEKGHSAMKRLGYPDQLVDRIVINPTDEQLETRSDIVPVWIEQRNIREIKVNGTTFKIGGKFDMVMDGRLFDTKTTSVYAYILGGRDEDYSLQGSIYRWLHRDKITSDHIYIQFVFTDWQGAMARRDSNYPQTRTMEYPVKLLSIEETDNFISKKLAEISKYMNSPDEHIPECTDKELWRGETTYKYFSDPNKTDGRSTRNFKNLAEANEFMASKGGKGVVIAFPGEVKACDYCPAFSICKQKDAYYDNH